MRKIDRRNFLVLYKSAGFVSLFPFGTPIFLSNNSGYDPDDFVKGNEQENLNWPHYVQKFPTLALDEQENPWIAVIERDILHKKIRVFCYRENEMHEVTVIQPEGITGISDPNICQFKNSMQLKSKSGN